MNENNPKNEDNRETEGVQNHELVTLGNAVSSYTCWFDIGSNMFLDLRICHSSISHY